MTKLLSFLVLQFTIVLVQGIFENAGEKPGIEMWRVDQVSQSYMLKISSIRTPNI